MSGFRVQGSGSELQVFVSSLQAQNRPESLNMAFWSSGATALNYKSLPLGLGRGV